jgi:hypothetical protein
VCQGALSRTTTQSLPFREAVEDLGGLGAAGLALHGVEERPVVPGQKAENVQPPGRESGEFADEDGRVAAAFQRAPATVQE